MMENNTNNENIDNLISDKLFRMQLADIRRSKMSQAKLSEISGLSTTCISSIESNENSSPTLRSLMKYMTALGVSLYIKPVEQETK